MGDAKRLAEELKETREELDELQAQLDQQLEDHNQEMEEFEENLKKQYADEIRTRDETIGQLEQQVTDTNAYWQEAYDKLQAEKDQMYTDYEAKLATWEKSVVLMDIYGRTLSLEKQPMRIKRGKTHVRLLWKKKWL